MKCHLSINLLVNADVYIIENYKKSDSLSLKVSNSTIVDYAAILDIFHSLKFAYIISYNYFIIKYQKKTDALVCKKHCVMWMVLEIIDFKILLVFVNLFRKDKKWHTIIRILLSTHL